MKSDEYDTLIKYLETFKHHFDVLKELGLDISSEELSDRIVEELESRGITGVDIHVNLGE